MEARVTHGVMRWFKAGSSGCASDFHPCVAVLGAHASRLNVMPHQFMKIVENGCSFYKASTSSSPQPQALPQEFNANRLLASMNLGALPGQAAPLMEQLQEGWREGLPW